MLTYFSDGEYIYRLLNWMTDDPSHLDAYWHMLDSFRLPGMDALATVEIPLSAKREATRSSQQMPRRMVTNCCGFSSSGNPFPCCDDGNCTWWCYYKHGYVPFTGNAGTWWGAALDYSSWVRASYPPTNDMSIACWSGNPGHVAHAASWSGVGNVTITEMDCINGGCEDDDSIAYTEPTQGWLYDIML